MFGREGNGFTPFHHILMPYTGTSREEALLKTACKIAKELKAKLSVVHVLEVPMTLPVDADDIPGLAEVEAMLDRAVEVAKSMGVEIEADLLQARDAGKAIVEEARSTGADLILMEVPSRRRLEMPSIGRTAGYLLKQAPCHVWISRLVDGQAAEAVERK